MRRYSFFWNRCRGTDSLHMPHVLWVGIVVVVVGVVVVGVLVLVIIDVVDLVEPNGTTVNTRRRELTCRNRCELPNH